MTQCRIKLLLQPITKLYVFTIELKLRDDFRCFRSKMCFRTFSTVQKNMNTLPADVTSAPSIPSFKRRLKLSFSSAVMHPTVPIYSRYDLAMHENYWCYVTLHYVTLIAVRFYLLTYLLTHLLTYLLNYHWTALDTTNTSGALFSTVLSTV